MRLTPDELNKALDQFDPPWLTETLAFLRAFSTYTDTLQGNSFPHFAVLEGVPLEKLVASNLKIEGMRHAVHILKSVYDLQEKVPTSTGLLTVQSESPKIKDNLVFGLFSPLTSQLEEVLAKREVNGVVRTEEIKLDLSFSPQTATMLLTEQNGKEYKVKIQGQVQKEVIRVVFEHPENTYTEWSLYDISETLGSADVDETAVKNAIYQFNRKVRLAIPEVESLFDLNKHSAQLNPKYVNKS